MSLPEIPASQSDCSGHMIYTSQAGPAPSHTWKGQGNVEYLSCALCDYSRNPIRLQRSLAWTMNPISLTVQDGEYLGERDCFHRAANMGERDCFHRAANLGTKALRYDRMKERRVASNTLAVFLCNLHVRSLAVL